MLALRPVTPTVLGMRESCRALSDAALLRQVVGPLVPRAQAAGVGALLEADGRRLRHLGLSLKARRRLQAVAELARRHQPRAGAGRAVTGPRQALAHLGPLRAATAEVLALLPLDGRFAVIGGLVTVARGAISHVSVEPREVFAPAIVRRASAVVLAHNHPSGEEAPSAADVAFTRTMARAGDVLGIEVLDHLVVTRRGYVSLAQCGLMPATDVSR